MRKGCHCAEKKDVQVFMPMRQATNLTSDIVEAFNILCLNLQIDLPGLPGNRAYDETADTE